MLADVHCHLDEIENIEEIIKRAKEAKVMRIVSNSINSESAKHNIELAKRFKEVLCAIGLHPNKVANARLDEELKFVERNADKCIAIGETGLDFIVNKNIESQKKAFLAQIELAKEQDKAIIVHSRGARRECVEILEKMHAEKVLLHWFISGEKLLKRAIDCDYFISIGPSVLFAAHVEKFVEKVPLANMLLETDAPVSYNKKQAEPAWILKVAEKVAEIKKISLKELEKILEKNFRMLFK